MLIDTHAHLNFEKFNDDYREVIERAFNSNVNIINVGSNLETSEKAVKITKEFPDGVYAAIGLHPIHVKDEEFDEEKFEKLAKDKKVVAIGETGLDYYYNRSTASEQKELFRKHIKIAQKLSKPLILHSRDAGDDVLSVLMEEQNLPAGVMHCFQGGWSYANVILEMGFYISFTGLITFTKNVETFDVIKNAPLERIMIETDCPYMTPEPHRGERNEPAFVVEVAKKIAEIKNVPLEEVERVTTENAKKLFKI